VCCAQVRDLCEGFHRSRREFQLLYNHHSAGGQMPATDDQARRMLLSQRLEKEDNQRKLVEAWHGRCSVMYANLKPWGVSNSMAACSNDTLCAFISIVL
jgi:hypothetical protein